MRIFGRCEPYRYICRKHSRKRFVMNQRRYEGACHRTADAKVTFCEKEERQRVRLIFYSQDHRLSRWLALTL